MNTFTFLLRLFSTMVAVGIFQHAFSQIHVDSLKDVGIGTAQPAGAKLRILTPDDIYGLHISNTAVSTASKYGLFNAVDSSGTMTKYGIYNNVKQNPSSSQRTYCLRNEIEPNGTGQAYGIYNEIIAQGTGLKYGIYNIVSQNVSSSSVLRAIYNVFGNGGSDNTFGIFNQGAFFNPLANDAIGIRNIIIQDTSIHTPNVGQIYGIKNDIRSCGDCSSNKAIYGIFTNIEQPGGDQKYGMYTHVKRDTSASEISYGIYSSVVSNGGSKPIYGQYSAVNTVDTTGAEVGYAVYGVTQGTGASNSYAGFFNGKVVLSQGYTTTSDSRVKKNIKPYSQDATYIINALKPVTFEYNRFEMENAPIGMQYGFIAQEVEIVVPELVTNVYMPGKPMYKEATEEVEGPWGKQVLETVVHVGEEPQTALKSLNYEALIPILVKAIQEQEVRIEDLNQTVSDLKSRIEVLERK